MMASLLFQLGCSQSDVSFKEVTETMDAMEAFGEMGGHDIDFLNYCGTIIEPGGYASFPETILGTVWQRPIECIEDNEADNCSFRPDFNNLDKTVLNKQTSAPNTTVYEEYVYMDTNAEAGDLLNLFSVSVQSGSLLEINGVMVYKGLIQEDSILEQQKEAFLDTHSDDSKEQVYVWSTELFEWTLREHSFVGTEAGAVVEGIEFQGGFYQESGIYQKLSLVRPCVYPFL